ncbi:hypothetical protein ABC969_12060 [Sphingomonas qilianensis]|uniref:Uncharacterized protein n=2 Tax=Sphingomonas qilianensis TaxID=1736690 RepID=A0ABU9XUC6_9SPHN
MTQDKPTTTQPSPNISTGNHAGEDSANAPTTTQPAPNISTEHQAPGDARRPGDQLDRQQDDTGEQQRKSSLTKGD